MIYFKETLNLTPASPETRDDFISFATTDLIPTYERLGARLVGAWFSHTEWYGQVTQVLELDDLSSFQSFRANARDDAGWHACEQRVEGFAPRRASVLLEPLGPVPPNALHTAMQASSDKPIDAVFAVALGAPSPLSISPVAGVGNRGEA